MLTEIKTSSIEDLRRYERQLARAVKSSWDAMCDAEDALEAAREDYDLQTTKLTIVLTEIASR